MARSKISGYGLFAKNDIPSCSVACLYSGDLVKSGDMPDTNIWIANIDDEWGIDASKPHNFSGRYANHALNNNCVIVMPLDGLYYDGRIKKFCLFVQTERYIYMNEELTANYGKYTGLCRGCYPLAIIPMYK